MPELGLAGLSFVLEYWGRWKAVLEREQLVDIHSVREGV
jgi:hypothetical protein